MPSEEEIAGFMFKFTQTLIIWGSDDVVLTFVKFRDPSLRQQGNILFAVENIWLAIRKDLGHTPSMRAHRAAYFRNANGGQKENRKDPVSLHFVTG